MKTILFLSSSYPQNLTDWRGLFIRHLADALARHEQVNLQLWAPPGETHTEITRVTTRDDDVFLADLMKKGGIAHLLRTGGIRGLGSAARLLLRLRHAGYAFPKHAGYAFPKDIYPINWLQNALPLPTYDILLLVRFVLTYMQLLSKPLMKTLFRRTLQAMPNALGNSCETPTSPS